MNVEVYEQVYRSERDNWWYRSRRELITDMVARAGRLSGGDGALKLKILDVGCGTGLNSQAFEEFGEVYGLDMSEEALGFSKSRGRSDLIRAYADHLPIKDDTFDVLCALDLLEHVEDDIGAIREFHRVLKPGGSLILTVPAFMFLWSGHDEVLHHKRRYEKELLTKNLHRGGFYVDKSTYWNTLLFPGVAFARVIKKRKINHDRVDDLLGLPDIINNVLFYILKFENLLIEYGLNLPFGVSILCICRKKSPLN